MSYDLETIWDEYDKARRSGESFYRYAVTRLAHLLGFLEGIVDGFRDHRNTVRKANQ